MNTYEINNQNRSQRNSKKEDFMEFKKSRRIREFNQMYSEYSILCHRVTQKQGLSDSAYEILWSILVLGEGCTQTNIYQNRFMNKQTVNSSVKNLIRQGVLYTTSGKGRENRLFLTEKGKKLIAEKIIPIENAESEVLETFSEKNYRELLRLTALYLKILKEKLYAITGDLKNYE